MALVPKCLRGFRSSPVELPSGFIDLLLRGSPSSKFIYQRTTASSCHPRHTSDFTGKARLWDLG
jgi:hypothetical protein